MSVSVQAVKCFVKVNECEVERSVPFHGLFNNDGECGDVVGARSVLSETGLLSE